MCVEREVRSVSLPFYRARLKMRFTVVRSRLISPFEAVRSYRCCGLAGSRRDMLIFALSAPGERSDEYPSQDLWRSSHPITMHQSNDASAN
jgi:hypothetical protein